MKTSLRVPSAQGARDQAEIAIPSFALTPQRIAASSGHEHQTCQNDRTSLAFREDGRPFGESLSEFFATRHTTIKSTPKFSKNTVGQWRNRLRGEQSVSQDAR